MDEELKVTVKEDGTVSATSAVATAPDIETTPLQEFLSVKDPSVEQKQQLSDIWNYLKSTGKSSEQTELLYALRSIENRLSPPRLGETRLNQLHQYIKLDQQIKSSEKLRDALTK